MELAAFQPENELERAILSAKQGRQSTEELLATILSSNLYVSSKKEVQQDGSGFDPLLVGEPAKPLVAAFSSLSASELHAYRAEYVLQVKGRDLVLRLPSGYGVILNPGYAVQFIITSAEIARLKAA